MKILLLLTSAIFWGHTSFALPMGGEAGNGGQDVALEFATFGTDITYQLLRNFNGGSDNCKSALFGDVCNLDISRIRSIVQTAKITSMPSLTQIDPNTGAIVRYTALNYPQEQRILISEAAWKSANFCYVKKLPLVLHEYLGLLGIEIQNYRYSSVVSEWLIQTATIDKFQGCPELYIKGDTK